MKYAIYIFFFCLLSQNTIAQNSFFNQGGTTQKNYFSTIKFENIGGAIIVKATMRGETYRFLLDTGAPNAITKALYEKLRPRILSEVEMVDANGVANKVTMVMIEELTFGNVVFENIPTGIIDSFMLMDCLQIDGFIGSNMLRNSVIQFAYMDEMLILTDKSNLLNLSENHASDIEFPDEQSSPYIEIGLRGEIEGGDIALFDTGFKGFYDLTATGYDTLFSQFPIFKVKNTGYGGNSMGLWGFNEAELHTLSVAEMHINGSVFHNVTTQTSTSDYSKIGNELLKYGKVTLDYIGKKFYFQPYSTHLDLTRKEFPINPKFEGNKLLIGTIWGEEFAKSVKVGDQIIAIDSLNSENINPCEWIVKGSPLENKNRAELVIKKQTGETVRIFMKK